MASPNENHPLPANHVLSVYFDGDPQAQVGKLVTVATISQHPSTIAKKSGPHCIDQRPDRGVPLKRVSASTRDALVETGFVLDRLEEGPHAGNFTLAVAQTQ